MVPGGCIIDRRDEHMDRIEELEKALAERDTMRGLLRDLLDIIRTSSSDGWTTLRKVEERITAALKER